MIGNRAARRLGIVPASPRSLRHEVDTNRAVAWWRKEHLAGREHTIPSDLVVRVLAP